VIRAVLHRLRPVTRLLAAILFIQVAVAPAHCLAMAAVPQGLEAVICAPDGMRTVHLGPDGQEVPAHQPGAGFCAACHGLPQVALPDPPAIPAPAWLDAGPGWHAGAAQRPPQAARAPPYSPTGPPTAS
jgi:hypothetical protein